MASPGGRTDGMASIPAFYSSHCVLVTGATGFVGRALLSRLLRLDPHNPSPPRIYLLIRPKRGASPADRLSALVDDIDPVLTALLASPAGDAIRSRLCLVEGDVGMPELGMSDDDMRRVNQEVSVIFHCAANVAFRKEMRPFIMTNVLGLSRIVSLAKQCANLQAFIHVSTAFSNAERGTVQEMVYAEPTDPMTLVQMFETMDDDLLEPSRPKLMGRKLNSYAWSKAVAEHYLSTLPSSFPVAIVRPSIITSSVSDPVPGWVAGMQSLVGPAIAVGTGLLQVAPFDARGILDLVPIDKVINSLLTVAWWRANTGAGGRPLAATSPSPSTSPLPTPIMLRPPLAPLHRPTSFASTMSADSVPIASTSSLSERASYLSLPVLPARSLSDGPPSKAVAAARKRASTRPKTPVFHICSSHSPNRITTGRTLKLVVKHSRHVELAQERLRKPNFRSEFGWQLRLQRAVRHQLVASTVDTLTRTDKLEKIYGKIDFLVEELRPIVALQTVFLDHASRDLDRLVQATQGGKAFSTATDWQWDGYFEDMIKGIKQFVTDPQERKKAAARGAR